MKPPGALKRNGHGSSDDLEGVVGELVTAYQESHPGATADSALLALAKMPELRDLFRRYLGLDRV